jgi:hypothetical protein
MRGEDGAACRGMGRETVVGRRAGALAVVVGRDRLMDGERLGAGAERLVIDDDRLGAERLAAGDRLGAEREGAADRPPAWDLALPPRCAARAPSAANTAMSAEIKAPR